MTGVAHRQEPVHTVDAPTLGPDYAGMGRGHRRLQHLVLLSTAACLALMAPAVADTPSYCASGDPVVCTLTGDGSDQQIVLLEGENSSSSSQPGGAAPALTAYNYGAFDVTSSVYTLPTGALHFQTTGGDGHNNSAGGVGGMVTVANYGDVSVQLGGGGGLAAGIMAMSRGGDGDDDNDNNNSNGGDGGAGGAVWLSHDVGATLTLSGDYGGWTNIAFAGASGLVAASIGGYGGAQNNSVFGDQHGGAGGDGGAVTLLSDGVIAMGSQAAPMIGLFDGAGALAVSAGGMGGADNGDAGSGGAVSISHTGQISAWWNASSGQSFFGLSGVSMGGEGLASHDDSDPGGDGGAGGGVTVTISGAVDLTFVAQPAGSYGGAVRALSLGGAGGTGPTKDHTGGQGGHGGGVQVTLQGGARLQTSGDSMFGVLAQSIGGSGGDGGDGDALAGEGGGGGQGGDAGAVTVTTFSGSTIATSGAYATGVAAHAVGGGGGTGADFVAVLGGQGGNGGNGGNGADVLMQTQGQVTTQGDHAYGLLSQSIAGSGGAGGADTSKFVALGGDGAGGGTPGAVSIANSGVVTTAGYAAHGVVGQSIGGGGGAAGASTGLLSIGGAADGSAASAGGAVTIDNRGQIVTAGAAAIGLLGQSVGGGGGTGGDARGIAGVGGSGEAGGDGGAVQITAISQITTSGTAAHGVLAHSVGGGGGNGGDVMTISALASLGVGGAAAGAGNGGAVCVDNSGGGACYSSGGQLPPPTASTTQISTLGDYAAGILAQSIGGGGGSGGSASNVSLMSFLALQIGGAGAGGGAGGAVSVVQSDAQIATSGARAIGALAQSVGGGGGTGGAASYYDLTIGFNAGAFIGGAGGGGGHGGDVTVALSGGQLVTGLPPENVNPAQFAPTDAFGVVAQSIGGGGGNGGGVSASDMVVAVPTGEGVSLAFNFLAAVGGYGGGGGDGGTVGLTLTNGFSLTTLGDGAHGVIAQSVGGGGGNGGDSSTLATTIGDGDTVEMTASIALGGGAASAILGEAFNFMGGGHGGAVSVTLSEAGHSNADVTSGAGLLAGPSAIRTYGDQANAVLAQSIGGGGGNGGIGDSNPYAIGGAVAVKAEVGVGGAGGDGGDGGPVYLTQYAGHLVQTYGSGARGLVAQSLGGGGGTAQGGTLLVAAGASSLEGRLSVSVGQSGGSGGDGDIVSIASSGVISTRGGDADGIVAQSIGGGGGLGGSIGADAAPYPILDRIGNAMDNNARRDDSGNVYTLSVAVGGRGGAGGHGGDINLYHAGQIATSGDYADAIVAQSIGGGGGAGGSSATSGSKVQANVDVAIGGRGGVAGNGGAISVMFDDSANVQTNTLGYAAHGVVLQSIGGGGGQGGDGSDQATGNLTIGGAMGGAGGAAGDGGAIGMAGAGAWLNVTTAGDSAHGLIAQSIGGGGGIGATGNATASKTPGSHSIDVTLGGGGGANGQGGEINLSTGLRAVTSGDRASAVIAQSIGGGGGLAITGPASNVASLSLGGGSGALGNGGAVSVTLTADTYAYTYGAGAHAVIAQSIGGSGGIAGDLAAGTFNITPTGANSQDGGAGGGNGSGGAVSVSVDGTVITVGPNAFGLIAQSVGGGGGLSGAAGGGSIIAGFAGGSAAYGAGGAVSVNQQGQISAGGANSVGIFAQSAGASGTGAVTVAIGGQVSGGSGDQGAGVWIAGGAMNQISIASTGAVSSANNVALRYDSGVTSVEEATANVANAGLISGDVLLRTADGATAGRVHNRGVMRDAAHYVSHVVNDGRLYVGADGGLAVTALSGDFAQGAEGALVADADFNSWRADHLVVSGDGALNGMLEVRPLSLRPDRSVSVLSIAGAHSGALTVPGSPVFTYGLDRDGDAYRLRVADARFAAPGMGLGASQTAVANHLQQIWNAGGTDAFGVLFAGLQGAAQAGGGAYASQLSDMSPGVALAPAAHMQAGLSRFGVSLMSCPVFSAARGVRESDCIWGQVNGRHTGQRSGGGIAAFTHDSVMAQAGVQKQVSDGWFLGLSAGYERSWLRGKDLRVSGEGDSGFVGATLKLEHGPWTFSGALSAGYGSFDLMRRITIGGFADAPRSNVEAFGASARLRVAYHWGGEAFYLKPFVDLDAIYTRTPGYRERSANILALAMHGGEQLTFSAAPSLEIGGRVALDNGWSLRPYASAGVAFLSGDGWKADGRLLGAPAGVGQFSTRLPASGAVARLSAGLQLASHNGVELRLQYDGEFAQRISSNSAALRLLAPF